MLKLKQKRLLRLIKSGLGVFNSVVKKFASPSEGEAGGGVGGIPPRPSAEAPPHRPETSWAEPSRKISSSFLEEKTGRAQNQESGGYFSARLPPER